MMFLGNQTRKIYLKHTHIIVEEEFDCVNT